MTDEMRVPLSEILGVPGFLAPGSKEQWLKDNRIVLENDWAGRESVDLKTAWRLKREYDKQYARAQAEARAQMMETGEVNRAQARRMELFSEFFPAAISAHGSGPKAIVAARAMVDEEEKSLPEKIRHRLFWPTTVPITFPVRNSR